MSAVSRIVRAAAASQRISCAAEWLAAHGKSRRLVILGPSNEAANHLARTVAHAAGSSFGWERTTLGRLAATVAAPELAAAGLSPSGRLPLEALCARVVHTLGRDGLGRFEPIHDRPGLPRALARTLEELRLAGTTADELAVHEPDLAGILRAYEAELAQARLADRAHVIHTAAKLVRTAGYEHALVGAPLLVLDVQLVHARERELIGALASRSSSVLVTIAAGDERTRISAEDALGVVTEDLAVPAASPSAAPGALARLQSGLFSGAVKGEGGEGVEILSAPGESRECIELVRRVRREAARGVPFDHMAIVVRAPLQYRAHLVEALRRANVPAYFARGTVRPDPTGRALLALLACAGEGLSARRFAEYMSLGEVPDAIGSGEPPPPLPRADRWVPPDEELLPASVFAAGDRDAVDPDADLPPAVLADDLAAPVVEGTLRAPYRWERLLVDAAVIGGKVRWERRLDGLRHQLEQKRDALEDPAGAERERIEKDLVFLASLRGYALPIVEELAALPASATWRVWIDALGALATRALRRPERVLGVLAELEPMAEIGPVDLREVRLVLERRLTELVDRPTGRRFGSVYVASTDEIRGMAFDVVFVPGLAEKIFPQKISEDPILPDRTRKQIRAGLTVNADRSHDERLALRLAAGAAKEKIVLSYPRLDLEQSRPRTPSFYALEVLRAAEGRLPGFDELARRAEKVGGARIGWPAPARAEDAVDEAEHDLALLESILKLPEAETVGTARYLLGANAHLARALRFRARRWTSGWSAADGLIVQAPKAGADAAYTEARAALDQHSLTARSFSPTALQHFAGCPYRFVLQAIHRLSPREEPESIEELDPLQRGSLVHEVEFELHMLLREQKLLPVTKDNLETVRSHLDAVLKSVAKRYEDDLAPAIDQVWQDGLRTIAADLREMLRLASEEPRDGFVPAHFELSFGLVEHGGRDVHSRNEPVLLDIGIKLRGSIDLIEEKRTGEMRATDYKTGKARAKDDMRIGGGETLQPVLYALVLEKLFPGKKVEGGRLYYCTSVGGFKDVLVPLDAEARDGALTVAKTIGAALSSGFLPAAPDPAGYGCEYCDFKVVCGPYEEHRTGKVKSQTPLAQLVTLRKKR
ncbi:MAG: ATP-dependent nuclease, subunit [Myxococcaceae bacterium]|nr:ATP-dependent nuclease, subunit [Myxococcaceae bacterium]